MSLIEHLKQIRDFRTRPHYPLWVVLVLILMVSLPRYLGSYIDLQPVWREDSLNQPKTDTFEIKNVWMGRVSTPPGEVCLIEQ